jgi:hypothetical protein
METFTPVANSEQLWVNHKNRVRTDNVLENLEWASPKQNANHWRTEDKAKLALRGEIISSISRLTVPELEKLLGHIACSIITK